MLFEMKYIVIFFCALTLMCIKNGQALQTNYMDGVKTRIEPSSPSMGYFSSGILKSHRGLSYPSSFNKTLNVSAPFGHSLLVAIKLIDLRPLNQDELKIFAINGQVSPVTFRNSDYYKHKKYYPSEELTFFAPTGQIGIRFTTGPSYVTHEYEGFELIYTVQKIGLYCFSDTFRCDNGRCIAEILTCDGHNHCGDQSSKRNCNSSAGRKVGISLGVVFLIIAITCGIYIAIRKARQGAADTHTIITSHPPPPTNLPSYPPMYPQPGTCYPPPPPPYSQGVVNPTYH